MRHTMAGARSARHESGELMWRCLLSAGLILVSCISAVGRSAAHSEDGQKELACQATSYCGAHCLYTILRLYGQHPEMESLVTPEYISSSAGSSLADLRRAASDHGLYAFAIQNLSIRELKTLRWPVILYVKTDGKQSYNHFLLYLGARDGKAMICDPPNPMRLIPFSHLLWKWGGTGLVVSDKPINLRALMVGARWRWGVYVSIVALVIVCFHVLRRQATAWVPLVAWRHPVALSVFQGVALLVLSCGIASAYHLLDDRGFRQTPEGTQWIQVAHRTNFIPKISKRQLQRMLAKETPLLVDARFRQDYEHGHIEGAASIPVDADDARRKSVMTGVDPATRIIVYCQSSRCKYAESVATALASDGYRKIVIYRGGWLDWAQNAVR